MSTSHDKIPVLAEIPDDIGGAALDQFVQALAIIAQGRLVDRRASARRVVEALYRLMLALGEHQAIEPISDLRDAFVDLEAGRRPELFEPRKTKGRRPSIREHKMKAWAIAAAEELEARGFDSQRANRDVASVVNDYGLPLGRRDTKAIGLVVSGWRRNLGRSRRTPEVVSSLLPGIREALQRCDDSEQVLRLLAHVGFEDVQFAPVLGKRAAKPRRFDGIEG